MFTELCSPSCPPLPPHLSWLTTTRAISFILSSFSIHDMMSTSMWLVGSSKTSKSGQVNSEEGCR